MYFVYWDSSLELQPYHVPPYDLASWDLSGSDSLWIVPGTITC